MAAANLAAVDTADLSAMKLASWQVSVQLWACSVEGRLEVVVVVLALLGAWQQLWAWFEQLSEKSAWLLETSSERHRYSRSCRS